MLSVALAALVASPAFADDWTDITKELNVPVDTLHANGDLNGDIHLEDTGSIKISLKDTAAVTINSSNAFKAEEGSTIANTGVSGAAGILVDLTTQSLDSTLCGSGEDCFNGLTVASDIDLSGSGDTKRGIWLKGRDGNVDVDPAFHFTGAIDLTGSTMTITGDNSVGIQIDSLAELDGNLTLGQITIKPSSTSSTAGVIGVKVDGAVNGNIEDTVSITATGNAATTIGTLIGIDIAGAVNGNVIVDQSAAISVDGNRAQGILVTGSINCGLDDTTCANSGAIINKGTIQARASFTGTNTTGNPTASSALYISGNVLGGIFNAGSAANGDDITGASLLTTGFAPAVHITPQGSNQKPIEIGIYQPETIDPGFSFYNRGTISAVANNQGDPSEGVDIGSDNPNAKVTLDGGFYNSGAISANAVTGSSTSAADATALNIGDNAIIGPNDTYDLSGEYCHCTNKVNTDPLHDDWASIVNSASVGGGQIIATTSGSKGGEATAIHISALADVPSLINTGAIRAAATTSDTSIAELNARGIWDQSGSLTYIQNNGTIQASATELDENGGQIIRAIDLNYTEKTDAGTLGVLILNQATTSGSASIIGDISFGTGVNQIVRVEGVSTDHVATILGDIHYGGGSQPGSDQLVIGDFATVTGKVFADENLGVSVDIQDGGTLNLRNDSEALTAYGFHVRTGGELNITVLQDFRTGIINSIDRTNGVMFDSGAKLNITYGSFVPNNEDFVLISAPHVDDSFSTLQVADIGVYNAQLADHLPFLFESAVLRKDTTSDQTLDQLLLHVDVKDAAQLGLTGYAAQILPFANQALVNDDALGAAFVAGINDADDAQRAYNQMAPDVAGGARAIAIALTDQSSGPVAARQRLLRMYGKESGDVTLWGEEFAEFIQDPGRKSTGQTGFKDHGFGFVLGLDGGDPKSGWYGGAFSFYSGDIVEPLPRDSHTNTLWYMLTGYTDWRGRGLFLDTKFDVGYMTAKSKRFIDLTIPNAGGSGSTKFIDEADSKRPGVVGALGFTTGAILNYGSTTFTPQISVDGMTMRQEGYTETHPTTSPGNGKGLLLQTQSYYASSARIFLGTEVREDLNMGDFFVQPDLRIGYRYDFLNDATKLKVNFADIGTNTTATPGQIFTVIGPDPAQGNFVAGAALAATTDAWTLGVNFDFVRGTNGATTEVGTIHLLGRI